MCSYSSYYKGKLYPLQNGVLKCVKECKVPFFLTGGTALSRGYFNHRYSDDLDFFVCADNSYSNYVDTVLYGLKKAEYLWDTHSGYFRTSDFCTLNVYQVNREDVKLKLDFVNDVAGFFGGPVETKLFFRTDSLTNILTNKISALFRMEVKDVVDLREIALNLDFSWNQMFLEAQKKEAGIEPTVAAEILMGMPVKLLEEIKWVKEINSKQFLKDIRIMVDDILKGKRNGLYCQLP